MNTRHASLFILLAALSSLPASAAESAQPAGALVAGATSTLPAQAAAAAPAGPTRVAPAAATRSAGSASRSRAQDRVELDTTQITGSRELPKVMYVVPWKKPDMGEYGGRPPNSLLDDVLQPADRDVFRRQNRYYAVLQPDAAPAASGVGGAAAAQAGDSGAPIRAMGQSEK